MLEELDLPAWIERGTADKRHFREAVHIVLTAIGSSVVLRSKMVMKGGLLMAIRYDSTRFTRDIDFSTREKYIKHAEVELLAELDEQLTLANDLLPYDTLCRRQKSMIRPARPDARFPSLALSIGYAQRSKPQEMARLLNGQAPLVVEIDYSYNEAVYDIEVLGLGDGDELQAYSYLNLLAEKMRSLLQQPKRQRYRRQDVYDLHLLITGSTPLSTTEKTQLRDLIIASCKERDITATGRSFSSPEIRAMSAQGYQELTPEIDGELPVFETAYRTVQDFYESLPWNAL